MIYSNYHLNSHETVPLRQQTLHISDKLKVQCHHFEEEKEIEKDEERDKRIVKGQEVLKKEEEERIRARSRG